MAVVVVVVVSVAARSIMPVQSPRNRLYRFSRDAGKSASYMNRVVDRVAASVVTRARFFVVVAALFWAFVIDLFFVGMMIARRSSKDDECNFKSFITI